MYQLVGVLLAGMLAGCATTQAYHQPIPELPVSVTEVNIERTIRSSVRSTRCSSALQDVEPTMDLLVHQRIIDQYYLAECISPSTDIVRLKIAYRVRSAPSTSSFDIYLDTL
jgi:hypothetical protein